MLVEGHITLPFPSGAVVSESRQIISSSEEHLAPSVSRPRFQPAFGMRQKSKTKTQSTKKKQVQRVFHLKQQKNVDATTDPKGVSSFSPVQTVAALEAGILHVPRVAWDLRVAGWVEPGTRDRAPASRSPTALGKTFAGPGFRVRKAPGKTGFPLQGGWERKTVAGPQLAPCLPFRHGFSPTDGS